MHVLKIAGEHYINHWNFFSLYTRTLRGNRESTFTSFLVLKKNNIHSTWNTTFQACVWTCMSVLSPWPASSLWSSVWEKWLRWVSPHLVAAVLWQGLDSDKCDLLHLKDPTTPKIDPSSRWSARHANVWIYWFAAMVLHEYTCSTSESRRLKQRGAWDSPCVLCVWSLVMKPEESPLDCWQLTDQILPCLVWDSSEATEKPTKQSYFPVPSLCVFPTALSLLCGREKRRERVGSLPLCLLPSQPPPVFRAMKPWGHPYLTLSARYRMLFLPMTLSVSVGISSEPWNLLQPCCCFNHGALVVS